MPYWLLKTEPDDYSYDRLEKDKKTVWDGVTNPAALKNMRAAKKGDLALVYHTGDERQAVGIAEVASAPYADKKDEKLALFDVKAKLRLVQPVTLAQIKASPVFAASPLVKQGRLSVVPLSDSEWRALLAMAKTKV